MEKKYSEVSEYYNKLWAELEQQHKNGVNSRHRIILKKIKQAGLKKNSVVLEIGCGGGILSGLILKEIPDGYFVGADISNETIEFVRKKHQKFTNAEFVVSDMTKFSHSKKFDVVVLPDVLEHIPKEAHPNIFRTIKTLIKDTGVLFINIPNPMSIEWHQKHKPELMQIIDQPLYTNELLNSIYPYGFYLENFDTYALFYEQPDYQSMTLRPKHEFKTMTLKPKFRLLFQRLKLGL